MASNDSLFSFEVAVECLRIDVATVACRFPAIAFRLLDFPSLLIPHLDENERRHFKEGILFDHHGEIPLKFKDLLDSRGNFEFNKGKSCMFKFDLEKLYEHLHNVPLYVIITDLWGDVPKLVGISTVALTDIVTDIRRDVREKGISFPSMHGSKDTFAVYNLMGSQVGKVDLGYRLLSLGMSLLPHLPTSSFVKERNVPEIVSKTGHEQYDLSHPRKEFQTNVTTLNEVHNLANGANNMILEEASFGNVTNQQSQFLPSTNDCHQSNVVTLAKPYSEGESAKPSESVDMKTQTHLHKKMKPSRNKGFKEGVEDERSDIVVTNTHCPPPLYFNAKWDSHNGCNKIQRPYKFSNEQPLPVHGYRSGSSESLSESSDSYHSRMMQVQYSFKGDTPERIRKVVRDSTSKEKVHQHQGAIDFEVPKKDRIESDRALDKLNVQSLPILTALLQELSLLTGSVSISHAPGGMADVKGTEKENRRPLTSENTEVESHPSFREKPDLTLSHSSGHRSCRHKLCAKPPQKVPSAKGWLRQEPVFRKKETKLHFKMTYSQKLRLKKNNPELLRTLEAEEKNRQLELSLAENNQNNVRKKTKKKRTLGARRTFSEHAHLQQAQDVPTEVERRFYRKTETSGAPNQSRQDSGPSTSTPTARPPVPTPRMSLTAEEAVKGLPERVFGETEDISNSERSARSIEVFIPNPSIVDSDGQSGNDSDSENDHVEVTRESFEKGEFAEDNDPGFPTESLGVTDDLHPPDRVSSRSSYSQDFESAQDGSEGYSDNFDDSPSYHTPREEGEEEDSFKVQEKSESFSPQLSMQSKDSSVQSDQSRKSRSSGEASHLVDEEDGRTKEKITVGKPSAEIEESKDTARNEGVIPKAFPKRLAIPQPQMSSTSPVPQQRIAPSKIVMVKPVSVADMEFNDSVEVNLPSDLSESFDISQSRPTSTPLEASGDVAKSSSRNQWQQSLDVIRSESEKRSEDEYSEDFVSEFDDSDD